MTERCDITTRRARKMHICDVCGGVIPAGSEYVSARSIGEGRTWYNRLHIHCDAVLDAYTRHTGKGVDWECMDDIAEYLRITACGDCGHDGECLRLGRRIFGCRRALRAALPTTVLYAALESARKSEEE